MSSNAACVPSEWPSRFSSSSSSRCPAEGLGAGSCALLEPLARGAAAFLGAPPLMDLVLRLQLLILV